MQCALLVQKVFSRKIVVNLKYKFVPFIMGLRKLFGTLFHYGSIYHSSINTLFEYRRIVKQYIYVFSARQSKIKLSEKPQEFNAAYLCTNIVFQKLFINNFAINNRNKLLQKKLFANVLFKDANASTRAMHTAHHCLYLFDI